jgi:hypothetical protein
MDGHAQRCLLRVLAASPGARPGHFARSGWRSASARASASSMHRQRELCNNEASIRPSSQVTLR